MSQTSSVLLHGRDPNLLSIRAQVLRTAGFNVLISVTAAEAYLVLSAGEVDLLILCHTLSQQQCEELRLLAHSVQPRPAVILLASDFDVPDPLTDRVVDSFEGPRSLIKAVRDLTCNAA